MPAIRARAFAKINLSLRVLGVRRDGYHELETLFQSIALHDTLTFTTRRGPFEITCSDPACPVDETNLVWLAAQTMWRAEGREGAPRGVRVHVEKRIPLQAGLGGGSSDAAVALRAFAMLWRTPAADGRLAKLAAGLGSDVPFFLRGGTARGRGRGHRLRAVADRPTASVVLVMPGFGVSTRDAYGWWDEAARRRRVGRVRSSRPVDVNDLEAVVAARHPEIAALVSILKAAGAHHAAMSGSGSAVFGLFDSGPVAAAAARAVNSADRRAILTETLPRPAFARLSRFGWR